MVLRAERGKGNTSAEDIIDWAREHMAAYKVPRMVEFVDALPKTGRARCCGGCCRTKRRRAERPVAQRSIQRSPSRTKRSLRTGANFFSLRCQVQISTTISSLPMRSTLNEFSSPRSRVEVAVPACTASAE